MPDPLGKAKRLQEEIRAGRQAFYRGMAAESAAATNRLEAAYQARLVNINKSIAQFARAGKDSGRQIEALQHLRENITRELDMLQGAVVDVSAGLQANGIEAGYRFGLTALQRGGMNVMFNQPTLETIQATINYVDSPAWRGALGRLGTYHAQLAADKVLDAAARGVNPRQTAIWLRAHFATSPKVDALRMARTTQIYGARRGTQSIYQRTGVGQWIWSAAIGSSRTCLSCIALHGTVHPSSELCNDHHNGRCAPIPKTPLWAELGFEGGEVPIQTGIEWFNGQSWEQQRQIMGPGMHDAYLAGQFQLNQVPRLYSNDIFGLMYRKSTLGELTGRAA